MTAHRHYKLTAVSLYIISHLNSISKHLLSIKQIAIDVGMKNMIFLLIVCLLLAGFFGSVFVDYRACYIFLRITKQIVLSKRKTANRKGLSSPSVLSLNMAYIFKVYIMLTFDILRLRILSFFQNRLS